MIYLTVAGIPAPQGSKRPVRLGNGRIGMAESSRAVGPWRDAVRTETQRAVTEPMEGPLRVSLIFRLRRPASLARSVLHPVKRPDLDKLVRSTLDGLVAGGAFADDSQVVELFTRKEYGIPGCMIRIDPPGRLSGGDPW